MIAGEVLIGVTCDSQVRSVWASVDSKGCGASEVPKVSIIRMEGRCFMTESASFQMVRVGDIKTDGAYQRAIDPRWVAKLAANWDQSKAGVIVVAQREDGSLYAVDGGHRVGAARSRFGDDYLLPAIVLRHLGQMKEAELFDTMQRSRKPLTPRQVFHARLAYAEPAACAIFAIVSGLGLTIGASGGGGSIAAVSALDDVYKKQGGEMLHRVLRILRDGFTSGHRQQFAWQGIKGLRTFLRRYPGADDDITTAVLKKHGPEGMLRLQFQYATPSTSAESSAELGWAKGLYQEYNRGRRNRLADWG